MYTDNHRALPGGVGGKNERKDAASFCQETGSEAAAGSPETTWKCTGSRAAKTTLKKENRGTWGVQPVKRLCSAQVMIPGS